MRFDPTKELNFRRSKIRFSQTFSMKTTYELKLGEFKNTTGTERVKSFTSVEHKR